MPKRPPHHLIKRNMVYSVAEAAAVLGMHRQTVTRWIREHGLPAATDRRPWLIEGGVLKDWLIERREGRRQRLGPGEIFCLPCRRPVRPDGDLAEYLPRTECAGALRGICPSCDRLVHRALRLDDLDRVAGDLDVAIT